MTTAFVTSIVGIGISLYFKNYQADAKKIFHGVKTESNIADLIAYLQKSNASMTKISKEIQNLIVTANLYEQKLQQTLSEIRAVSEKTSASMQNLAINMHNITVNANNMTQKISATSFRKQTEKLIK